MEDCKDSKEVQDIEEQAVVVAKDFALQMNPEAGVTSPGHPSPAPAICVADHVDTRHPERHPDEKHKKRWEWAVNMLRSRPTSAGRKSIKCATTDDKLPSFGRKTSIATVVIKEVGRRDREVIQMLQQVDLFNDLTIEQLKQLAPRCHVGHPLDGHVIFAQGDMGDTLFVILEGEVHLHIKEEESGKVISKNLGAGDWFGELALDQVEAHKRSGTITALGEMCRLLSIDSLSYYEIVQPHKNKRDRAG